MKWYGDLGASSFPFSFSHGKGMSPVTIYSRLSLITLFQKYLAFICQGPCGQSMACRIFITEFISAVWMCGSLLSSYLQGNCNPDWAKETSTEEQGAAQAARERWDHPCYILWNPRSVLTDPCVGLHHVKHWITSVRSQGSTDAHVQKDPSSPIKCVTATGTLIKHSYWVTVPPLSPPDSTPANTNGIKLVTLSASSTLDFAYLYFCFCFLLTLISFLVFQVNALFICFSLLPCFVSVFHCPLEDLNPFSLSLTLPPVANPFPVLLI